MHFLLFYTVGNEHLAGKEKACIKGNFFGARFKSRQSVLEVYSVE